MAWIDWAIVLGMLVLIFSTAISTKKYTQSVADFLAANRCAGRYLLCISEGMAGLGAVSVVAMFEKFYVAGFTAQWWAMMMFPIGLLIMLSGWVVYRYRETRAMTMAQFFEMRYSKRFRVFAGILGWVSGVVNMGIFPSAGAYFFIYFCGLPESFMVGGVVIGTYPALIIFLLAVSIFFVFLGGQIAVMITDFVQGMFTNVTLLIIMFVMFWLFDWGEIVATLKTAPENQSLLHPFHTGHIKGFNFWYFAIGAIGAIYGARAWQGSQGYFCSAKSAHEAKMAGILGAWRGMILFLVVMLLPIGAWVVMHSPAPEHRAVAAAVNGVLDGVDNSHVCSQASVPLVLVRILPVGVVGLLCAVMLAAFISTHDTYLHSWGSMFVQDVILPFRKKPFTPKQHFWLLRISILTVAVFIFLWSWLFPPTQFILMFFAMTGTIYLGGAGACIVGGLYWKRGSTSGAWAAFSIGAVLGIGGLAIHQSWKDTLYPWLSDNLPGFLSGMARFFDGVSARVPGINWKLTPDEFAIDGQWFYAIAMSMAAAAYVGCSFFEWWVLKRPAYNMDRLLHRGRYVHKRDKSLGATEPVSGLRAILPSGEFTRLDKVIYYGQFSWTMIWIVIFVIGTTWGVLAMRGLASETTDDGWAVFWKWNIILTVILGTGTTIWFFFGGLHDIKDLYSTLRTLKRDHRDIGMVVEGHDLSEEPSDQVSGPGPPG